MTLHYFLFQNTNTTAKELNNDLAKDNRWTYQWKMSFNPDPTKQTQTQEAIFGRKPEKGYHPYTCC